LLSENGGAILPSILGGATLLPLHAKGRPMSSRTSAHAVCRRIMRPALLAPWLPAASLLCGITSTPASADVSLPACTGQYQAARIQTMPSPVIVDLSVFDTSDRNTRLARRFTEGLRVAGMNTAGTPTAHLRLTVQMLGLLSGGSQNLGGGGGAALSAGGDASGGIGDGEPGYSDWGGLQGGVTDDFPDMPPNPVAEPPPSVVGTTLVLRAELRTADPSPAVWIANVQCSIETNNLGDLAYRIGRLIGGALGRTVNPTTF
jgi:hypothetical protein